jgi:hypothetical protein
VKPEVGHFRIFGCSVYIHVPKEKRTYLDPLGIKVTFVAPPRGTFRESKRPHSYSCYAAATSHIIDSQPSCYEEASSHSICRDAMMEEYQSIMKNDVWDIVMRPEGKSVVTSEWIYKDQTHN